MRIISASNKDLPQLIQIKEFREDLFYRCNVIGITIPSLRQRREDIVVLANYFLTKYADLLNKRTFRFSAYVLDQMLNYPWPGNVRELENAVERMVNLTDEEEIEDIAFLDTARIQMAPNTTKFDAGRPLKEMERVAIINVLRECRFNVTESAKRLGISKPTLYKKIQGHNIPMERGFK
ncbi:helix-turn-helix domain-containing protein [Glaciimonas sp. PCH181]|uniref:helix-turn-helix domain-containing protein n=1 Tax=Glaciimonas sp. PCH181 TaxID=2133943 RepID=UPI001374C972|nr:helix-turn-helix domain-containing protein [Glaciimonas sp. PCH181]